VHGCAPEVVEEDVLEGGVRPQVSVVLDGAHVVEDEAALQAVVVAGQARRQHHQRQQVGAVTTHGHPENRKKTHFQQLFSKCRIFGNLLIKK